MASTDSSSIPEAASDDIDVLKLSWISQQKVLKTRLVLNDSEEWQLHRRIKLVGGMDLSTSKEEPSRACCTLVVCAIPDLNVVYEDTISVILTIPYVAGFLAFREVEPCLTLYRRLVEVRPDLIPEVILFDGNGVFHPRGLGLASHFGVLADVCTIGVAKNLHQIGAIMRNEAHVSRVYSLKEPGETVLLEGNLGVALKTCQTAKRPVYVSVGHRISLETAVWVVMQCIGKFRIPEPIRQADIRSRIEVRKPTNSRVDRLLTF